jgi:subtilisin family serine protease
MRKLIFSFALTILAASGALAATPEQEKAFVDAYKTAFEAQNADGLAALFFSEGAIPEAVDFYKMAMTSDFGKKVTEITLQELTPEEVTEAAATMDTPDGGKAVLLPKPYKKLVIKVDTSDASGTSSSTNTIFVAEKDGKLGVAMPAPAK